MAELSTRWGGTVGERVEVAVVGAGVIGACVARELALAGRSVTVLERGGSWAAGCSWGNAGFICPSHAGPWASRSDVTQAVRWLLRPDSPLAVRPTPAVMRFLLRLLAGRGEELEAATAVSRHLCVAGLAAHERLDAELGTGFTRSGMLDVYTSKVRFERGQAEAEQHRRAGVRCEVLDADAVAGQEPALADGVVGGVLFVDEAHCEPALFVEKVGADAERLGARLLRETAVLQVRPGRGGVEILTDAGVLTADRVVVAAGAWAGQVAGVPLTLAGGKGYAVDCAADGRPALRRPLLLQEARIAVTPLTGRLRLAGTMQFAGLDERIDPARAAGVRRGGVAMLPSWADARVERIWSGLRPCTPDGLPLIGFVDEHRRVAVATGHAMLGLTQAVPTADLVRQLLDGETSETLHAVRPERFRR